MNHLSVLRGPNYDEFGPRFKDMTEFYSREVGNIARKVAEENNITEMRKEIPVNMPAVTVCWYTSKWYFSSKRRPKFDF